MKQIAGAGILWLAAVCRTVAARPGTGLPAHSHRKAETIPSWVINCREVLRELSNYMEGDLDPELRSQIDSHLAQCRHCTAVYEGTRNLLTLVADGKVFELPEGFSRRLRAVLGAKRGAERDGEPGG